MTRGGRCVIPVDSPQVMSLPTAWDAPRPQDALGCPLPQDAVGCSAASGRRGRRSLALHLDDEVLKIAWADAR